MIFNAVVSKVIADDKKEKYIVILQGQAVFDNLPCLVETSIIMVAKTEEIIQILPRGKVFKVELKKEA